MFFKNSVFLFFTGFLLAFGVYAQSADPNPAPGMQNPNVQNLNAQNPNAQNFGGRASNSAPNQRLNAAATTQTKDATVNNPAGTLQNTNKNQTSTGKTNQIGDASQDATYNSKISLPPPPPNNRQIKPSVWKQIPILYDLPYSFVCCIE